MNCPNCNGPCRVEHNAETGEATVYCPRGRCNDPRMNDGATGVSPEEAYQKLCGIHDEPMGICERCGGPTPCECREATAEDKYWRGVDEAYEKWQDRQLFNEE